jgi:DNA-directed RNA polymerase subunit K/omega
MARIGMPGQKNVEVTGISLMEIKEGLIRG